jgi:hypothetical protein
MLLFTCIFLDFTNLSQSKKSLHSIYLYAFLGNGKPTIGKSYFETFAQIKTLYLNKLISLYIFFLQFYKRMYFFIYQAYPVTYIYKNRELLHHIFLFISLFLKENIV